MKALFLLSASVATLAASGAAFAQDAAPQTQRNAGADNEIIVTATRRNERLQDVPLSITAIGQEELVKKGAVGYEGLRDTAGVVLNRPSANFNNFTARGIATNGYNANLQSTVAIYIDELPISANGNSTILDPNLFDVQRVEFLRGPQGTLFGSGSLAGAVRILTNAPDLDEFDWSGVVDFGQTQADSLRQRYNGMVNIPLLKDRLALRVVGFYRDEEGYIDNIGTGIDNANTLEAWGGRASLLAQVTDRLSVRVTGSREDSEPQDSSTVSPSLGRNTRISDRPDQFWAELTNYNVTVNYDFDGAEFVSSSTYATFDQRFVVDLAGTFGQAIRFALDAFAYDDIWVEEARLASDPGGRWDWVVGGFYFQKRRDVDYNYRSTPEFLAARGITGLPDEYYQRFSAYAVQHEKAAFGELVYRFTDDVWVTGGIRYGSTDVQSFTEPGGYNSNYLALALTPGGTGPVTITPVAPFNGAKAEGTKPSYKASLSWRATPTVTTYATYSTGFRSPIVNARAGAVSVVNPNDIVIPFGADSDSLRNYELGLKGRWLDGALSANLALYQIDWENIQVQANRVSDQVQFATNVGAARSTGLEFEIMASPLDSLDIGLNGSFNESKIVELSPSEAAISGAVLGARLASPRFAGTAYATYNFEIGEADAFVTAGITHVGEFPGMFPNTPGNPNLHAATYAHTQSYDTVNLSAGASIGDAIITAYIENLNDDYSITYVHPEAFIASRFATLRPRTFGIRLAYSL